MPMPLFDHVSVARRDWAVLVGPLAVGTILLIAAWLRFANLGYSEFQGDEIRALARLSEGESLGAFLLGQRKPPGQWLITYAYGLLDPAFSSHVFVRLPFAIAGVISVIVFYLLVQMYFANIVATAAAALMATNGIFVGTGRIVQYQPVTILLSLLSLLFLSLAAKHERWALRGLYLGALSGALALLTHFGAASIILPASLLLYWWYRRHSSRKCHIFAAIAIFIILVGSFYIPFLLSLTDNQLEYWRQRAAKSPSGLVDIFVFYNTQVTLVFYAIFLAAALPSIKKNAAFLFLSFWLLPPLFVLEVVMPSPGTHIYSYWIPLFIVAALGFEKIRGDVESRYFGVRRIIATGVLMAGLFWSFAVSHLLFVDHEPEFPWNDKQVLGMSLEGGWRRAPMMGFPHRRDWGVISEVLKGLPDRDNARFVTNERDVIARFYLQDTMREFSRGDVRALNALYLIVIERPQSWKTELLGRSLDYWRSQENLSRVTINDLAEITLLHPDELRELPR